MGYDTKRSASFDATIAAMHRKDADVDVKPKGETCQKLGDLEVLVLQSCTQTLKYMQIAQYSLMAKSL